MIHKIKQFIKDRFSKVGEQKKRSFSGSYTVEMALLFPVILGVLVFSLGLTFYLYNLCVLDIHANLTAIQGRKFVDMSENAREKKIQKLAEEEIQDRLIAMQNFTASAKVKGDKVSVSYSGEYTFPIVSGFLGGGGGKETISVQAESVVQDAVEWIRTIRKAKRIVDYIKERAE